ncbi:MAG: hypothetical protein JF599_06940 [Verrucomicrobia bacterium]|nr:hypothetical protein [Verrucomicrobiota bacterium]
MTVPRFLFLLAVILGPLALFFGTGCPKKSPQVGAADALPTVSPAAPEPAVVSTPVPTPMPVITQPPTKVVEDAAEQTWREIKDYPFTQRADFLVGLERLEAQVEQQIVALKARRLNLTEDPHAWDNAMQVLESSLVDLRAAAAQVAQATSSNWEERTARVGRVCEREQAAYEKVKALTPP